MYILEYLKHNPLENLKQAPYYLDIKQDGSYFILKYNMLISDMHEPICQEARGCILRQEKGIWICVCRSLDKFGNWGEDYAATPYIEWGKGIDVQEKVDGSIIRCWFDGGDWHISTNGTIDAAKAECGDTNFQALFFNLIPNVHDFFSELQPAYTYWFELVDPEFNPIVVHYKEKGIYALGCRNMVTEEEEPFHTSILKKMPWLRTPRHFHYTNLDDVLEACHKMGEDEEGYVCVATHQMVNGSYLRIKCKGDEYLKRHRLRQNGPMTITNFISLWQNDTLDDFVGYFPEMQVRANTIKEKIIAICAEAEQIFSRINTIENQKDFALAVKQESLFYSSFLFARRNNKIANAFEWFKQYNSKKIAEYLEAV